MARKTAAELVAESEARMSAKLETLTEQLVGAIAGNTDAEAEAEPKPATRKTRKAKPKAKPVARATEVASELRLRGVNVNVKDGTLVDSDKVASVVFTHESGVIAWAPTDADGLPRASKDGAFLPYSRAKRIPLEVVRAIRDGACDALIEEAEAALLD